MASSASLQNPSDLIDQNEFQSLAQDFFEVAESQLAKMNPEKRKVVIASIHSTAESLREEK